ncbi:MAG: hypothetical protein AAFR93_12385 [Pseudomonadota bacterium]
MLALTGQVLTRPRPPGLRAGAALVSLAGAAPGFATAEDCEQGRRAAFDLGRASRPRCCQVVWATTAWARALTQAVAQQSNRQAGPPCLARAAHAPV